MSKRTISKKNLAKCKGIGQATPCYGCARYDGLHTTALVSKVSFDEVRGVYTCIHFIRK